MPTTVDKLPGGSLGDLPWDEYLDGQVWFWSLEEIEQMGVKPESIRALSHVKASEAGMKSRTRLNDEGLFIQAVPVAA